MSEFVGFKSGREIEWLELNLLKNGIPLSKSKIIQISDDLDENLVDSILSTLEIRNSYYNTPIYSFSKNRVTPNFQWFEIPEYFLCLYYSYYGANDYSGGTGIFEKISAHALKNFINCEVITCGFPGGNFNTHLDLVSQNCHEERGIQALSSYKDDGVDVIGYKSFNDSRSSNLYVLLQCAAGRHWTAKKAIVMNRWTNYILWYPENIIQSISTVEFVENRDWMKQSSTYGMLLDRLRIYNFLYATDINDELRAETLEWCTMKLDQGL